MFSRPAAWLHANYRLLMVLVMLAAAGLRLYGLNNQSPPGIEHDEVAHWLINKDILEGEHSLYFSGAYGHEAGYHYLQTGFMVLLGDNVLALRLPSAYLGLLLVAVSFALLRRMFDLKTAVISAALLAALFWPVFYSRLALRAISLPLLSGLSAIFWWRGWSSSQDRPEAEREGNGLQKTNATQLHGSRSARRDFILAGLFAGLGFYTYMASRAFPIFYLLFVLYLLIFHRASLRKRWTDLAIFFVAYILVIAPLAVYLLANPGLEYRLSEVNDPLLALLAGDFRPVLENSLKILLMFGFRGDPLWRQNVAYLPVFEPILALFFYIGLLITLLRFRTARYAFLLLWLLTATIPSLVTIDAPSSIRIINTLPILTAFPVIGLEVIHYLGRLSTVSTRLSPKTVRVGAFIALALLFVLYIGRTSRQIYRVWPMEEEVKFVWQEALTAAAAYLDDSDSSAPVSIGGWSPDTMDPPTMELTLFREDLSLRFFDPLQSLIIPYGNSTSDAVRLIVPEVLPLDPYLAMKLSALNAEERRSDPINIYEIQGGVLPPVENTMDVVFGNELAFLGYDSLDGCDVPDQDQVASASCQLITYWQVRKPVSEPRRIFLHAVDENGSILDQDDGLGAPSSYWKPGDIILQRHTLDLAMVGDFLNIRLGVYNPLTGDRLPTGEANDYILLAPAG